MTLSKALVPSQTLATRAAMVLGGSFLIAAASQVSVPMFPVPMTLQTLAILTVGMTMGARMGLATVAAWLMQGASGLPVFAGGASAAALVGPTAGFLFGFLAMVAVVGFASDRGVKSVLGLSVAALVASAVLYLPGLAWPALVMGKSVPDLMAGWMLPFLAGDVVKAVLAALIVAGGWNVLKARRG
ncbi:biotin transporter BioY [Phaeovulum sp. NW3]|uniref:biotin transporter BioY n=1 Tax=Phaeovulum sp. NW3 TaxID=2934933 RepID=UPI0020218509|nr:biotin transporter BioY [Phaeovulum sp. NW3]MCL7465700.1 biotin transporter BioY [Phaeovulum sp. NW3]